MKTTVTTKTTYTIDDLSIIYDSAKPNDLRIQFPVEKDTCFLVIPIKKRKEIETALAKLEKLDL